MFASDSDIDTNIHTHTDTNTYTTTNTHTNVNTNTHTNTHTHIYRAKSGRLFFANPYLLTNSYLVPTRQAILIARDKGCATTVPFSSSHITTNTDIYTLTSIDTHTNTNTDYTTTSDSNTDTTTNTDIDTDTNAHTDTCTNSHTHICRAKSGRLFFANPYLLTSSYLVPTRQAILIARDKGYATTVTFSDGRERRLKRVWEVKTTHENESDDSESSTESG
jgi:hypothetical protein